MSLLLIVLAQLFANALTAPYEPDAYTRIYQPKAQKQPWKRMAARFKREHRRKDA